MARCVQKYRGYLIHVPAASRDFISIVITAFTGARSRVRGELHTVKVPRYKQIRNFTNFRAETSRCSFFPRINPETNTQPRRCFSVGFARTDSTRYYGRASTRDVANALPRKCH